MPVTGASASDAKQIEFCVGPAHRSQQLLRWPVGIAQPQSGTCFGKQEYLLAMKTISSTADSHGTYLQLYERFRPGQKPPTKLGSSRDYNVDMVPKFIMAGGELVRVLVHTGMAIAIGRKCSAISCI